MGLTRALGKVGSVLVFSFIAVGVALGVVVGANLTGCEIFGGDHIYDGGATLTLKSSSSSSTINSGSENVISPNQVTLELGFKDLQDRNPYSNAVSYIPSTGNSKLLILPIEIPGYEFSFAEKSATKTDLEKVFFGDASDTYWESVSSYYEESSYNQLHLEGTVLDWFSASDVGYHTANSIRDTEDICTIIAAALDYYSVAGDYNLDDYDSDNDGFIDGIWVIYSAPDFQTNEEVFNSSNLSSDVYWAYTAWNVLDNYSPYNSSLDFSVFGFASIYFSYHEISRGFSFTNTLVKELDAHTYVHETGHMFGLNDYYNYDTSAHTAPTGFADMMDLNIGDHNLYSKMLLGWVKPYIVIGDCDISLAYNTYKDSLVVLLPNRSKALRQDSNGNYIFNPFSEYILIENYTNEGLNEYDSRYSYTNGAKAISGSGFKVYHVDNRVYALMQYSVNSSLRLVEYDPTSTAQEDAYLLTFISNSTGSQMGEKAFLESIGAVCDDEINDYFNELTLIDEGNNYSYQISFYRRSGTSYQGIAASSSDLFKSGDAFSMSMYSDYFVNGNDGKFNNGLSFNANVIFE